MKFVRWNFVIMSGVVREIYVLCYFFLMINKKRLMKLCEWIIFFVYNMLNVLWLYFVVIIVKCIIVCEMLIFVWYFKWFLKIKMIVNVRKVSW